LQHLTPVPYGRSLNEISEGVMEEVEATATAKCDAQGRSVMERFADDRAAMRPLPPEAFDPRLPVLVSVSSKSTAQVEGARYSLPKGWARSQATAYVGVEDIRFVWRDEVYECPKAPRGSSRIRYRHYLGELAKKPQAVRQVAPELLGELGPPYDELWRLLVATYDELEAARVLARILGAVDAQGEQEVGQALTAFLGGPQAARQPCAPPARPPAVAVPEGLRGHEIEAARASDYDWLLVAQ
jgi:hypothetical protein